MKWKSRRPPAPVELPAAPVNVRVEHADGRVTPVECIYLGLDGDEMHVWSAIRPAMVTPGETFTLTADEIPPRTVITVGRVGDT